MPAVVLFIRCSLCVVDKGVVTLVGIVRCDTTEKRVLEQIARQAFEVTEVVNLRRVGH